MATAHTSTTAHAEEPAARRATVFCSGRWRPLALLAVAATALITTVRDVVLMPTLATLLTKHRENSRHSARTDHVFATRTGKPLSQHNVQRSALDLVVKRAKLHNEPKLRFHDLRHTFASLLIAQGANVVFVSRQLGHANPAITLSLYAHEFGRAEHATRVVGALERTYGALLEADGSESAATQNQPRPQAA
jgi:integrase